MFDTKYISCADTAKLIRKDLKAKFPNQKFTVNSKSYAGGASITVRWFNGPTTKDVEAITNRYESKSFDGSIDMACYKDHWMLPDGSVTLARTAGTEDSRGYIPAVKTDKPHPDAIKVSFGASYIFCERKYSASFLQNTVDQIVKQFHIDEPISVKVSTYDNSAWLETHNFDIQHLIMGHIQKISLL